MDVFFFIALFAEKNNLLEYSHLIIIFYKKGTEWEKKMQDDSQK